MKESKFLGSLLPSHPDLIPIIDTIREKYRLPEVSPDDEPIREIYLDGNVIPLEEFRQEIETEIRKDLVFLSSDVAKMYTSSKAFINAPDIQETKDIELLPENWQTPMIQLINGIKGFAKPIVQVFDLQINAVADMLYIFLLTGETQEVPNEWFGKVITITSMDEKIIFAAAGQMSNPDVIVQQFREEYKKTFGAYHPKITKTHTSTAYYLRLQKAGKPWKYIVEEYIRLNKLSLPRDQSSKRYFDTRRR